MEERDPVRLRQGRGRCALRRAHEDHPAAGRGFGVYLGQEWNTERKPRPEEVELKPYSPTDYHGSLQNNNL